MKTIEITFRVGDLSRNDDGEPVWTNERRHWPVMISYSGKNLEGTIREAVSMFERELRNHIAMDNPDDFVFVAE